MERYKLLIVDDEPQNLQLMRQVLSRDYQLAFATDGKKALDAVAKHRPDLILMDVMMPGMDGYQVCQKLKTDPRWAAIPVIFVTAMSDVKDESEGFDAGGVDYITKPIKAPLVRRRVKTHLSLVNIDELEKTRLLIIQRLGRAAEYKDNETGLHVIRMSHYCLIMAQKMGRPENWCELILHASPMHDVGKIGIPDRILLKPGPLNGEEWVLMKQHSAMGAEIIGEHNTGLLAMAASIALNHHEKWDGTGYPAGLKGEDIPLHSRIVAISDVFDALTTKRPYKQAWPLDETLELMKSQTGKHFDPGLIPVFMDSLDDILAVKKRWAEKE